MKISRAIRHVELASLAAVILAGTLISAAQHVSAAQPDSKKSGKKPAAYVVIAGTVFRDPGLAQPGATVTLSLKDDPKQKKLQEAVSDNRGEFAFRVPPAQSSYVLHAALKGYRPVQQDIDISGEEQVNATLLLVPESK